MEAIQKLSCESFIKEVVIYARGARVIRQVQLPEILPKAACNLRLPGLSPLAQDLQVECIGREVLGFQTELQLPQDLEAFKGALTLRLEEQERQVKGLEAQRSALQEEYRLLEEVELNPGSPKERRQSWEQPERGLGAALMIAELLDELMEERVQEGAELQRSLGEAKRERLSLQQALQESRVSERFGAEQPWFEAELQLAPGEEPEYLRLSYSIPSARWWPALTVRLSKSGHLAELGLDAFIAQASFEDWEGVSVALCTATLQADLQLPELPALRIGRPQTRPSRGFRPPPEGLDELFQSYDRISAGLSKPSPKPQRFDRNSRDDLDDGIFPPEQEPEQGPEPEPMEECVDLLMAPPAPQMSRAFAPEMAKRSSGGLFGVAAKVVAAPVVAGAAGAKWAADTLSPKAKKSGVLVRGGGGLPFAQESSPKPAPELEESWLHFDQLILGDPQLPGVRGRLQKRTQRPQPPRLQEAIRSIHQLSPPEGGREPADSAGAFAYRFEAQGQLEIPGDALKQRVSLRSAQAPAEFRYRCVPGERPEVFRESALINPFENPILGGPIDIFFGGALLARDQIEAVDRGGELRFGLGIEERVHVARNARVKESSHGFLGGNTQILHEIDLEISSALGHEIELELLERIPWSVEEEVQVEFLSSSQEPEEYTQDDRGHPVRGGLLWRLKIPPAAQLELSYSYQIQIPSKREIQGGNRREP